MADDSNRTRRQFLSAITLGLGGIIGLITAIPLVRYVFFPVRRKVVSSPDEPVDVIGLDELEVGAAPVRVELVADGVRDAWTSSDQTKLGAAWLQRQGDQVTAFSSVCPHLGCSINFDGERFRCPCHKSAFALTGDRIEGPSKRGLDPLPVEVVKGRVRVTYKRFKTDIADRVEARADEPDPRERKA